MRALLLAGAASAGLAAPADGDSFLQRKHVVKHEAHHAVSVAYERNLPDATEFLGESKESVDHVKADLKAFFKTVGELRATDLEEAGQLHQNYVSLLHTQEDEVRSQSAKTEQLGASIESTQAETSALVDQKHALETDNAALRTKLADLRKQVEQEVSGLQSLLGDSKGLALSVKGVKLSKVDEEAMADEDVDEDADADEDEDADDDADKDEGDSEPASLKQKSKAAKNGKEAEAAAEASDDADDADDTDDDEALLQKAKGEACKCTNTCSKGADPMCFVQSEKCRVATKCDAGKGGSCIKKDPKKGAWTYCSNILTEGSTVEKGEETRSLLAQNPNVAVAERMLVSLQKEVADVFAQDEHGAEALKDAYDKEKHKEEEARKVAMKEQKELEGELKELTEKKEGLEEDVQKLQQINKTLKENVDRFGAFLTTQSAKLVDIVSTNSSKTA